MFPVRPRLASFFWLLSLAFPIQTLSSQTAPKGGPGAERAQLLERLRTADSLGLQEEAFVIRARLRDGDFEVGDRIDVKYEGGTALTRADSLVIESGRVVRLGEPMGDLSLRGLLRSELEDSVKGRVDRYYKAVKVHVTSRMRLTVSGAVRSPGTLYARVDTPLSELIARAGGQDASTDLSNVVIKRGAQIILERQDVQVALTDGLTIERLNLLAGDELVVGRRTSTRWLPVLQVGLPILTIVITYLLRR